MSKRQRHVFRTSEVFHRWANQTQDSARNGKGSVFFEGPTIYSYHASWPLATIYTRSPSQKLVLTNSSHYSVTTSAHQSQVHRAIAKDIRQIAVPDPIANSKAGHLANIDFLKSEYDRLLKEAQRVLLARNAEWRQFQALQLYDDLVKYVRFFGLSNGLVPNLDLNPWNLALGRAKRIEKPDPIKDAKRFKERQHRRAKEREKLQTMADAWKQGQAPWSNWKLRRKLSDLFGIMLRIKGEEVQTSLGASIPITHAPRLWGLIQLVRKSGQRYQRNSHTVHAGVYSIDVIEIDGSLEVGCHTIPYSEIERIARELKLTE